MLAVFYEGCGSTQTGVNKQVSLTGESTRQFPFPTKEPEVYQCDLVISGGVSEDRYFVARKGEKWRFDIEKEGAPWMTQLRSDRVYSIDHTKKTYTVEQYADQKDFDTGYFNSLTFGFFRGANYLEYDEIERGGGLIKYKAKTFDGSKSDVVVTIDEATGMMVRQEITSDKGRTDQGLPATFIYEVRDLKMDVDDSIFQVPPGYRQVTR